jgi:dATP pyrophosphohydrolase
MRAPYQILTLPYRKKDSGYEFCIFNRSDSEVWQGIAGGGEDDETPLDAAVRETYEECGINKRESFVKLDSMCTIPVKYVTGEYTWGKDVFVIKEYAFRVNVEDEEIILSDEHISYNWVDFKEAIKLLHWDSNKNALWELKERLNRK